MDKLYKIIINCSFFCSLKIAEKSSDMAKCEAQIQVEIFEKLAK